MAFNISHHAFYLVKGINSAKTFNQESYTPQNQSTTAQPHLSNHQPITVLMMGTDTGAIGRHFRGRTDTMMLNTINPDKHTMTLTSIPRDAPAHYNNMLTKINSVYTLGGANQAAHYVQSWLGVPVNYYMLINMGGLDKIIDQVGGVTVNPPLTFKYGAANVKKHQQVTLNGMQALDYCRMRHQDPLGDYGRQIRQRQVLFQLFDKVSKIHNLALHPSLANALSDNMKTNLSAKDMMTLALFYRKANLHHVSSHLQGHTAQINGQDFEVVSPQKRLKKLA
ncbi:MAG: LytR family transcriptional regulator [Acetilactobacillus jinshanensis]